MNKNNPLVLIESERKRIADDLHDSTVQELVHLSQQLELTSMYLDKDINQARLELFVAKKNIKDIINGIRETIYDLRPMSFDDIGWNASFERLKDDISKFGINVNFDINKPDRLDDIEMITIYRIIREACINSAKYSHCNSINVVMYTHNHDIHITIRDNGKGFDVYNIENNSTVENHFGIQIMLERVKQLSGDIDFESNSTGTSINIVIPY